METGLAQLKQQFKNRLETLLPYLKDVDPNWISLSIIPLGLVNAWVYSLSFDQEWFYLLGALLVFLRLVLGNLDGLVAQHFSKSTKRGAFLSRLSCEFFDIALLVAITGVAGEDTNLGIWALAMGWATTYLGHIVPSTQDEARYIGPVSQEGRLLVLIVCSFLSAFFGPELWIELFLWWCIFGGMVTCGLRLQHHLTSNESTPNTRS